MPPAPGVITARSLLIGVRSGGQMPTRVDAEAERHQRHRLVVRGADGHHHPARGGPG